MMLIGNLGKDPEMVHFENGGSLAKFPIATTEVYKDKSGQQVERTEWHNVVLRNALAGIAEKWVKKGDKIYVEGKLRTRTYEANGQTKYFTEVHGDQMTMLGRRSDSNAEGGSQPQQQSSAAPKVSEPQNLDTGSGDQPDDLPF